jgi:predicted permease
VILLVGAGLMMRTFLRLQDMDLRVHIKNVLYAGLAFPRNVVQTAQEQQHTFQLFFEKLKRLPGVTAVSATMAPPPFGGRMMDVEVPRSVHDDNWRTMLDLCSEDFVNVMQIQLLRGRFLAENDVTGVRHVAVINDVFAQQYFANQDPIGQNVRFPFFDRVPSLKNTSFEVIGVVSNVRNNGLNHPPLPQAYLPHTLLSSEYKAFVAGTTVNPESLIPQVQQLVWQADPNTAMVNAASLDGLLRRFFYANPQFEFITLGFFATIGLLLVLIGIFSVMGYTVALQTHDIGVRMALGAARSQVVGMVLRKGMILVAAGLAIGIAGSVASARYLAHQFQDVLPLDARTYAGVLVLTVAAGLAACVAPARRAANIDPLEAIRCE